MSAALVALIVVLVVLVRVQRTGATRDVRAPLNPEQREAQWRHRLDAEIGLNSEEYLRLLGRGISAKRHLLANLARRRTRPTPSHGEHAAVSRTRSQEETVRSSNSPETPTPARVQLALVSLRKR